MTENEATIPEHFGAADGAAGKHVHSGACHCGAVAFEVRLVADPPVIRCNCSLCRKKNATMVRIHESDFRLVKGREFLSRYEWHTKTAKHYFCKLCGIYTFHRMRTRPDHFGFNASCVESLEIDPMRVQAIDGARLD